MRLLRPWILIRINPIISSRIGHFAANTELYLCERDAGINVPQQRHVDLFYYDGPAANEQLAVMWRRHLRVWPAWLLGPVFRLNRRFAREPVHEVGDNAQVDRDVHNLFERTPPHLTFSDEDELRGQAGLRTMGIPEDAEFICLIVRDDSYLKMRAPYDGFFDYHNYRDSDARNYVLAAEALADRGYYVIRMGAVVNEPMKSRHPKVIDYATNGMRSDFMDIYLGGKCLFCVGCAGFDAVPYIFRRPIAYVNMVPIGLLFTFLRDSVGICKKHWLISERRWLSLGEIFSHGVGFCVCSADYESSGVELVENSPEEIRDVVMEMLERLKGTWHPGPDDDALQRRFWEMYPVDARDACQNRPLHGKVRLRYGSRFLHENREWLECRERTRVS